MSISVLRDRKYHRAVGDFRKTHFADCRRFSFPRFGYDDQILQEKDGKDAHGIQKKCESLNLSQT